MSKTAYLGIDMGGSNIQGYAFDQDYHVLAQAKLPTNAREGYMAVLDRIQEVCARLLGEIAKQEYQLVCIGLCIPGIIEAGTQRVKVAPNLGWQNADPLLDLKNRSFFAQNGPLFLINDVNAGLLGELSVREPKPDSAVACFCGTGVGGAVYLQGRLVEGFAGSAGEIGHMVVKAKGKKQEGGIRGSLESYIGKWALNQKILKAIKKNKSPQLKELIDYDLKSRPVKSSSLKKAWQAGDAYTIKLMSKYYCRYLGINLAQITNLIEPQTIILGGGIMEALGSELLEHIQKYMSRYSLARVPELQLARLGDEAGAHGAALYARSCMEQDT